MGSAGCSPGKTPSRPPGRSSTRCWATPCPSTRTPRAAGVPGRRTGCCPTGTPGTTRRADHASAGPGPRRLDCGMGVAQAVLLAHALAVPALGTGAKALAWTLVLLLGVVVSRAAAAYGSEAAALRAAARVKSQLR